MKGDVILTEEKNLNAKLMRISGHRTANRPMIGRFVADAGNHGWLAVSVSFITPHYSASWVR
jgi:hypothetical protein